MKNFLFVCLLVALLGLSSSAKAQTAAQIGQNARADFAKKCTTVQDKMRTKIDQQNRNKDKHMSSYNNIVSRVQRFIAKSKEAGHDTAQLETDLATLQTKIEKFKSDYETESASLASLRTTACDHSDGTFREDLTNVKDQLKFVHADAADIRTFVRETILADMRAVKAQSRPASTGSSANNQ